MADQTLGSLPQSTPRDLPQPTPRDLPQPAPRYIQNSGAFLPPYGLFLAANIPPTAAHYAIIATAIGYVKYLSVGAATRQLLWPSSEANDGSCPGDYGCHTAPGHQPDLSQPDSSGSATATGVDEHCQRFPSLKICYATEFARFLRSSRQPGRPEPEASAPIPSDKRD